MDTNSQERTAPQFRLPVDKQHQKPNTGNSGYQPNPSKAVGTLSPDAEELRKVFYPEVLNL